MTDPSPPTDHEFDSMMDSPITRVKIATPWWTRVSAAILMVTAAVCICVLTYSTVLGVSNERQNARFARNVAAANIVATDRARTETDCVRNRNADLTRVSSQLVGLTAKLFVRLAQRDPGLSNPDDPIYAEFDVLARQRDADDRAVADAVVECRALAGTATPGG